MFGDNNSVIDSSTINHMPSYISATMSCPSAEYERPCQQDCQVLPHGQSQKPSQYPWQALGLSTDLEVASAPTCFSGE